MFVLCPISVKCFTIRSKDGLIWVQVVRVGQRRGKESGRTPLVLKPKRSARRGTHWKSFSQEQAALLFLPLKSVFKNNLSAVPLFPLLLDTRNVKSSRLRYVFCRAQSPICCYLLAYLWDSPPGRALSHQTAASTLLKLLVPHPFLQNQLQCCPVW